MTKEEFESISDEAFSYLVSDFAYSARPTERGGYLKSGFARRFVKGELTINFLFGDADSSHLCSVWFDDGIAARVQRRYADRALSVLLSERYPEYAHKSSRDLTDDYSGADAIMEYAALLREFGEDAIAGDYSAFPTLVYLLMYVQTEQLKMPDSGRPIGVFSSLRLAEKAIANRHMAMANHERADGYQIWCFDIDPRWLIQPEAFGLDQQ